jgi:hypothetical protein
MSSRANLLRPQPNPPYWPHTYDIYAKCAVLIMGPDDFTGNSPKLALLNGLTQRELLSPSGHFSSRRFVVFLKPGIYANVDFRVGCECDHLYSEIILLRIVYRLRADSWPRKLSNRCKNCG